jgi:galactokinase
VGLVARRDDRTVSFASIQGKTPETISLDLPIGPGELKWANYPKGVAAGLLESGVALRGADILFDSDVPLGGGLSSSASLEVATAMALLTAAGHDVQEGRAPLAQRALAAICQKAEHQFANSPCGIMDQSIAIMGRKGMALLLDCRSGDARHIPFDDPGVSVLVADTQVKHAISDGGYAARRRQCEQAAAQLGVKALRDATEESVAAAGQGGKLAGKELMRARHVVGEIARTLAAVEALEAHDYPRFGELMYASHASLRDDYEVSCTELDAIVEVASSQGGVYGARMTGGGFGGCAIVLAESYRAVAIMDAIRSGFEARFGRVCPIFATAAADGAGLLTK